jgi:hypothetical protein
MRFIRKEKIVTTIFNEDLADEEDIKVVFKNLYDYKIEFSIILRKCTPSHTYITLNFDNAKIQKVYEDSTFDLLAFKRGVKTEMKKVAFNEVIEIDATTIKHKVLDTCSDVTRWELLDL